MKKENTRKRWSFLNNNRGVTLLETMIAVGIFAIGISAVALLQYRTVNGNTRARIITDAVSLAEHELERIMELSYTHTDLDPATHTAAGILAPYTVTWDVAGVNLDGDATTGTTIGTVNGADSKQIDLTVTAPQLGGSKDITMVFFKDNLKP